MVLCYGERTFQSVCMADRYVAALRKAYPQRDRRVVVTERIFGRQADGSTDVYELSSGHTGDV